MNYKTLPVQFETDKFFIKSADEKHFLKILEIFKSVSYRDCWDGIKTNEEYVKKDFFDPDLPKRASKTKVRHYSIYLKESDDTMIGYLDILYTYPDNQTAYIGEFIIERKYQNLGFGRQIINEISTRLSLLGYTKINGLVSLKNWPALRFWINNGFNQISKFVGDKTYTNKTFSKLVLIKNILNRKIT